MFILTFQLLEHILALYKK